MIMTTNEIIETLLYSHLYTLIKLYDIRSGDELRHLGLEKLVNYNALEDIMSYHAMYTEISKEGFNHTDDMRRKLMQTIKEMRDELKG